MREPSKAMIYEMHQEIRQTDSGLLNLSTKEHWSWIILCGGTCPVQHQMLGSIWSLPSRGKQHSSSDAVRCSLRAVSPDWEPLRQQEGWVDTMYVKQVQQSVNGGNQTVSVQVFTVSEILSTLLCEMFHIKTWSTHAIIFVVYLKLKQYYYVVCVC